MIVESVAGVVSAVRDDDLVGRVGGDEFMVCLRDISSHLMVEAVAQRMCAAVREAAEASDDDPGPVSISLGIALYPQDGVTYEELYRKVVEQSTEDIKASTWDSAADKVIRVYEHVLNR